MGKTETGFKVYKNIIEAEITLIVTGKGKIHQQIVLCTIWGKNMLKAYLVLHINNISYNYSVQFSRSVVSNSLWPHGWTAAWQASLSITNSWTLLKLMSTESVMPSNHLILCHPLLLPPSIFPSIGVFSNESVLSIRWPKYWSFSFNISPSKKYSGLISFRMDWWDLLAVQGTLKSLL